jgi:lipoprotein-anchoring transpeptidase ErfK/SrfK
MACQFRFAVVMNPALRHIHRMLLAGFQLIRRTGVLALAVFALSGCVIVREEGRPPSGPLAPVPQPPTSPVPPVAKPLPPHPVPAPAPPPPAPAATAPDVILAVQTRLDSQNFSTGGIDGRWGSKSQKALAAWQRKNKQPETGQLDDAVVAALGNTNHLMTTYTVTAADHAALTPYPTSWLERSQQERLDYASIEEMLAEKFHLYRATLRKLNPGIDWPNPPAGTVVAAPHAKSKPLPALAKIEIRLGEKTLRAYDTNGLLAAHFPCSIAADKAKRPEGETLRVVVWAKLPDYTFDPDLFAEDPAAAAIGRKLRIPPGPNNPVGVAWIGLDRPGYGIHGTPSPEDISHTESHGCFRLTNWDALKLVQAVRAGLPVVVLP